MSTPTTLTAVIITFNEEKNILRCIDSVIPVVDEVIIIDSFSTDKTEELIKSRGVRFIQRVWTGYSDAKNHGNALASGEYILSVDADEELSPQLQDEIAKIKLDPVKEVYRMNRLTNFCGKWIRHSGWHPDWCMRLFKKGSITWTGLVHETLTGYDPSSVGDLRGLLYHYSFPTTRSFVVKTSQYAFLAAERDFKQGKRYFLLWHGILKPPSKFLMKYIVKLGFLDGREGFIISAMTAYERFIRYSSFIEISSKKRSS